MSDLLVELKGLRDNTWKVIEELRKQASGASIHMFVEKVYEEVIYKIEDIQLPTTSTRKYRHTWERKIENPKE